MSYRLSENEADTADFEQWSAQDFASFLKKAGMADYGEVFLKHKISGRLAPLLTDLDLKEMGINIVGDRLRLKAVTQSLTRKKRYNKRTKIWWEGTEQLYFSDVERCLGTCGGCCPDDPSTYKLTTNHLKVKTVMPQRCGPIKLCCCYEYSINNLDLSKVNDVDVFGEPAPCLWRTFCCASGKDHIEVQTPTEKESKLIIVLKQGEGDRVSTMILHQIEEAQIIERD